MAHSDSDSVLNAAALDALRSLGDDNDSSLLLEVIELYLADAQVHVRNLRAAHAAGDVRLLERTAHTLKSSSANVGALGFSTLCFELEKRARQEQLDAAPSLIAAAESQFATVERALRAIKS